MIGNLFDLKPATKGWRPTLEQKLISGLAFGVRVVDEVRKLIPDKYDLIRGYYRMTGYYDRMLNRSSGSQNQTDNAVENS